MFQRLKWCVPLLAGWMLACGEPALNTPVGQDEAAQPAQIWAPLTSSTRSGMGATLYTGGVMFRIWAPNATRVWVTGDFNSWGRTELGNEFNGNFSGDVAGATRYQKYKYIVLNKYGGEATHADPRSARMENSAGASIIHDPNDYTWVNGFGTPGFNDMVIYELHIGTFNDSPGFGPGNFTSAIAKLDHLASLGVNMIEVMPVFEFPGDFSWGYNPSMPFAPEVAYGTPWDMKHFVDEAHKRGIGVIFDVVHNHWGPNDLPMWCNSNDCLGAGGEYFFTDWRKATPWGNSRPDYGRAEVVNYIRDSMMMLLNEYRGDGLRWDATKYIRTSDGNDANTITEGWNLFRSINNEIDSKQPWKISIAEDFGAGDAMTKSTSAGGGGFDSQWAGEFVHPVRDAVIAGSDSSRNMLAVRDAITQKFNGTHTQRVIYSESHDEDANGHQRLPEEIWPGNAGSWAAKKRSTLAAGIALTSPGIPMIFEGQEFNEDGYFADSDPVDWSKATTYSGIVKMYTDMIHLRRNWNNNTRGLRGNNVNVFHVNNTNKVLGYHRWDVGGAGDDVVVVANFSGTYFPSYNIGFPRGGTWYLRFNSDASVYSSDFGNTASFNTTANSGAKDGLGYNGSFAIGPYTMLVFSQ